LLCDAGLLDRFREEHWVYYRVSTTGIGSEFARTVSELIAKDDAVLQLDQRRMATVLAARVKDAIATQTLDPASAVGVLHDVLIDELGSEPVGELLDIGTGTGHILHALGANATRAIGVDISTEALRIARTQAHSAGLSHCLFRRGDMYGLPFAADAFDTVTMDRVLASATHPAVAIAEAARTLRAGGRLCLVEDFDLLAGKVTDNPLAAMRRWLADAGLQCERLRPFDTRSAHMLVAIGRAPNESRFVQQVA
jgi:ubiquinone/menaquinone biosynthesis C-methylase UbiE